MSHVARGAADRVLDLPALQALPEFRHGGVLVEVDVLRPAELLGLVRVHLAEPGDVLRLLV
eukprot:927783-Pyramimonas_sp.AAC.1